MRSQFGRDGAEGLCWTRSIIATGQRRFLGRKGIYFAAETSRQIASFSRRDRRFLIECYQKATDTCLKKL
jgi:hypothetical protein